MNKEYQFTLENFIYVVKRRIVWVILIGIAAAALTAGVGYYFITPKYSSTAKLYVNMTRDQNNVLNQSELTVAKSLVSTYIVVIESDSVLGQVADEAGVDYTPSELRDNIKASSIANTEAFSVTVTDPSAKTAKKLADAIVKIAPDEILRVVEAGSVKIIDSPKEAAEPDDSGLKIYTAVAFIFAALVAFVIFFLTEVMDVTVYTEEDLAQSFDYPIIGTIPTFADADIGGKGKKKSRREVEK